MATNNVFAADPRVTFPYDVPAGTVAGDFVMVGANEDIPGVAVTSRGDATSTEVLTGLGVSITYPSGGVGVADDQATVATTGTWELPVTGAGASTGNGVPVYINDAHTTLSLTASGENTVFGITNYPAEGYARTNGVAPVRIGAPN